MYRLFRCLWVFCVIFLLSGCGLFRPYHIDIQQGNVVTQEMRNDLTLGMTKKQVVLVLGMPVLNTRYTADTWYYVYSMQKGHQKINVKRLTLEFKNNKLTKVI